MTNFAILLSEYECISVIKNVENLNQPSLEDKYLTPVFQTLMRKVSTDILNAKLNDLHIYRFKIEVHAQKSKENE